jgi:hypothetical protein
VVVWGNKKIGPLSARRVLEAGRTKSLMNFVLQSDKLQMHGNANRLATTSAEAFAVTLH